MSPKKAQTLFVRGHSFVFKGVYHLGFFLRWDLDVSMFRCDLLLRGEMLGRLPSIFSKMEVHCVENCWEIPSQMKYNMWKALLQYTVLDYRSNSYCHRVCSAILWRGVVTLWIHTWRANEQGMIYIIYHISMQWWTKEQLDGCWGLGSHVASMLLRTFSRFNSRLIMTNTARDSTNKKVRFPGPPGLANKRVLPLFTCKGDMKFYLYSIRESFHRYSWTRFMSPIEMGVSPWKCVHAGNGSWNTSWLLRNSPHLLLKHNKYEAF